MLTALALESGEGPGELSTRVDVELLVDVAEVVLDGLRAEEQRDCGFARRVARC